MKLTELTEIQWQQVHDARAEWLDIGLSTAPADRPTAETAITEMYRLIGKPAPQFMWVGSPATANLAIWLLSGKGSASLDGSLSRSLAASLSASLDDSLDGSLAASLSASLDDSLAASLDGSLDDSLRGSLYRSLYASLRGSMDDSLYGSLGSLDASLYGSLRGSLGSLDASLYGSLYGSLSASLRDSLDGSLRLDWSYLYGQGDAYWIAGYEVPRRLGIVTYDQQQSSCLDLWADLARSAGWWWPYDNICVISDRPAIVHTEPWFGVDARVRLHCADGPALRFRDGWEVHSWHGTHVPKTLIEDNGWTTEEILTESNQEIRRCAIERIGWDQFIHRAGLAQVGPSVPDPGNPGNELALYDLPERLYDEPVRVLLCTNGTVERDGRRRRFGLTTPVEINDPVAAAAWTYDWPVAAYRELEARR